MKKFEKAGILVLLVTFGVLVMVGCSAPAPTTSAAAAPPDYAAELKPAFDAYIDAWNTQNYDNIANYFAEDFHRIAPDQNVDTRDGLIEFMRRVHATYPDFHIAVGDSAYLKDESFNQWTATGTATLEDGTQVPVKVDGLTLLRYADGKITEERVYFDTAQLTKALGAIPHAK